MAVPSSGALGLYSDIGVELGVPQSNVSLGSMSDSAGFAAPDAMSDFYGYVDAIAPSVTTSAISNVGTTTLRANGNVSSDGGATISQRGFYIGTNSSSPTNNTKYTVGGTTGSYLYNASGLSDNTTYYCWAFATNSVGTTYGARVQSTTVQAFTPTYALANLTRTQVLIGNINSAIPRAGTFTMYGLTYYINPITGGYVGTYNDNDSAYLNVGDWFPANQNFRTFERNPASYNWVTNAQNEHRAQMNTTIGEWNNYYSTHNFELTAYPGKSFTNYSFGNVKTINLGTNQSSSRLYASGNGDTYGATAYIWARFNYS